MDSIVYPPEVRAKRHVVEKRIVALLNNDDRHEGRFDRGLAAVRAGLVHALVCENISIPFSIAASERASGVNGQTEDTYIDAVESLLTFEIAEDRNDGRFRLSRQMRRTISRRARAIA